MESVPQFHTFDQMALVLGHNAPHALVQDWWSRLEGAIRDVVAGEGGHSRKPVSELISRDLVRLPGVSSALVDELHRMRQLRNRCAHGEAPALTADEARAFARRAWAIAWSLSVTPSDADFASNVGVSGQ